MNMYLLGWAIWLLPLAGVLCSTLAYTGRRAGQTCIAFCGLAAVTALWLLGWRLRHLGDKTYENVLNMWQYAPSGGSFNAFGRSFQGQYGVHVDELSLAIGAFVTVLTVIVMWHGSGYQRNDANYRRIVWVGAVLEFAVLGMVLAPNLLQVVMMWLVTSATLWFAASHWADADGDPGGAWRGFVANHLGDAAILGAVVVYFSRLGSDAVARSGTGPYIDPLGFSAFTTEVTAVVHHHVIGVGTRTLIAIAILLGIGVAARAAQGPFAAWLLGLSRTPLLTMVLGITLLPLTGVVVLARLDTVVLDVRHAGSIVAVVAAASALVLAVIALAQHDAARALLAAIGAQFGLVLATMGAGGFSNPLSMALSVAGWGAVGLLAVGNIVRSYRTRDLTEIAGAWTRLRTTSIVLGVWVVLVAGLDLVSYDALAALVRNTTPIAGHLNSTVVLVTGGLVVLASAAITAFAVRLWVRLCRGEPVARKGFPVERIHDVERGLRTSLIVAAVMAAVPTVAGIPAISVTFSHFVFYGTQRQALDPEAPAMLLALAAAIAGAAAGWLLPLRRGALARAGRLVAGGLGLEPALDVIGAAGRAAARVAGDTDRLVLESLDASIGEAIGAASLIARRSAVRRLTLSLTLGVAVVVVAVGALVAFAWTHLARGVA